MSSFMLDRMRVHFAGTTNIGRKREHNEDSIFLPTDDRLAVVCDGMGGHASGDVASSLAVDTIVEHFRETAAAQVLTWPYKVDRDLRTHVNRMRTAVMLANLEIGYMTPPVGINLFIASYRFKVSLLTVVRATLPFLLLLGLALVIITRWPALSIGLLPGP